MTTEEKKRLEDLERRVNALEQGLRQIAPTNQQLPKAAPRRD